jgi:hypothetical protein
VGRRRKEWVIQGIPNALTVQPEFSIPRTEPFQILGAGTCGDRGHRFAHAFVLPVD